MDRWPEARNERSSEGMIEGRKEEKIEGRDENEWHHLSLYADSQAHCT